VRLLIGSGLLARSFAAHYERRQDVIVFASGVSDSRCDVESEYRREESLLRSAMLRHEGARLFVYFSTCSVFDPSARDTRYVRHKLEMEDLVSQLNGHLVLRLPVVVGNGGNPRSLVRSLVEKVKSDEVIEVWRNAGRYLVDVDDVVAIGHDLIANESARNERINIAGPHDVPVPELVSVIGKVVGKSPRCRFIERGSRYAIDTQRIRSAVARARIRFDSDYVERVLCKYHGSAPDR
jgi:nucleoside-diphosphate-sugar epimerase